MLRDKLKRIIHSSIAPIYNYEYRLNRRHFRHLQTICLALGFAKSANQILAGALTAHPSMAMPSQINALEGWWNHLSIYGEFLAYKMLLSDILKLDRRLSSNKVVYADKKLKFPTIPHQWQGRFERMTVIGDCSPITNTKILMKKAYKGIGGKCMGLKVFQTYIELPLKVIFFVYNPYDLVATGIIRPPFMAEREKLFEIMVHRLKVGCMRGSILLDNIPSQQVYIWHLEDYIVSPRSKLSELCSFLGVEPTQAYLEACTEAFPKQLHKARHRIDWPKKYKVQVAEVIKQYDFLSDYDWDS